MTTDRPPFPDPRQLPRHSLANVVTLSSDLAKQYRAIAGDTKLPESEYVASMFESIAGWLDAAQVALMHGDLDG